MENILISACLLGAQCRYDGESKPLMQTVALMERYHLIPICPEQLGGLPTPREPSERLGEAVVTKGGADVTAQFSRGIWRVCSAAKKPSSRPAAPAAAAERSTTAASAAV